MGGLSSEHEISIKSGEMVVANLDTDTYKVSTVVITSDGDWAFSGDHEEQVEFHEAVPLLKHLHPDCIFIALHGPYGEDGRIQGMLDLLAIPYVGSGCAASALAIDKVRAKFVAAAAGIPVAQDIVFTGSEWHHHRDTIHDNVTQTLGYPCVVKSPLQGSSLGMAIPKTQNDFSAVVDEILRFGSDVLVEKLITGIELTCSVLERDVDSAPEALPVTEIRPKTTGFFDYTAKYTPGACDEITPADIPDAIRDEVQDISIRAHNAMGCRGFSRSDMILDGEQLVWLEVNTIPGLTETSLFPQAAEAAGMPFPKLLDILIQAALI